MATNWFYLHFRDNPPAGIVELLEAEGVDVFPVFETSFDLVTPFSAATLKRLLKSSGFACEFNLVKVKKSSEIVIHSEKNSDQ